MIKREGVMVIINKYKAKNPTYRKDTIKTKVLTYIQLKDVGAQPLGGGMQGPAVAKAATVGLPD